MSDHKTTKYSVRLPANLLEAVDRTPVNRSATLSFAVYEHIEKRIDLVEAFRARPTHALHKGAEVATSFSLKRVTIDQIKRLAEEYGVADGMVVSLLLEAHLLTRSK
jgi:predicted DNA-binding protein